MTLDLSNPAIQLLISLGILALMAWTTAFVKDDDCGFWSGIGPILTMIFCIILAIEAITTMTLRELWPEVKRPQPVEHAGPPLMP